MSDPLEHLTSNLSDRYAIEREIGRGGMAVVYLAEDLKHSRRVAVKVLGSELSAAVGAERFQREIEIAARLNHPNILTLIDSGEAGKLLYYVMPYVEGDSLRDRLADGPLPVADAAQVTREVGAALAYAHGLGIVHRDIKPENILFHGEQAVITDFGIARAVTAAGGEKLTQTGIAVGTPAYMSPEQGTGSETIDARSDIYSLGSVLYEMLVGEPPYTGRNARAILARKMVEPVSSIRTVRETVPIGLETAVNVALAKEPADRFTTAEEFIEALDKAGTVATPVPAATASPWTSSRRLTGVGLAAITLVAAAWWTWGGAAGSGPSVQRLVVMPFDNLTADSTPEFALAGLYEGLRLDLQQLQAVDVLSPQTAQALDTAGKTLTEIAREHDVDVFLEGSLSSIGDSLRLTLELRAGSDERAMWSDEYRVSGDSAVILSMLYASVIQSLAEEGALELTTDERNGLVRVRSVNPEAQKLYNESLVQRGTIERSIALLEEAIQLDPEYAEAHALLASSYISAIYLTTDHPANEAYPIAEQLARQAIALDETLGEGHSVLGWSLALYDWEWDAALGELERGFELDPANDRVSLYYSFVLSMLGKHDEAIAVATRAAELAPLNLFTVNHVGTVLLLAGRYDEALGRFNRSLELDPNLFFAHSWVPIAYSQLGLHDEAIAAGRDAAARYSLLRAELGWVLGRAGHADEAVQLADQLLAEAERGEYPFPFRIAMVYGGLGDKDRAFDLLDEAVAVRDGDLGAIDASPFFDSFRSDPRFDVLLKRLNLSP